MMWLRRQLLHEVRVRTGGCRISKKLNRDLGDDELKGLASAANNVDRNAAVQRGEFPLIMDS